MGVLTCFLAPTRTPQDSVVYAALSVPHTSAPTPGLTIPPKEAMRSKDIRHQLECCPFCQLLRPASSDFSRHLLLFLDPRWPAFSGWEDSRVPHFPLFLPALLVLMC